LGESERAASALAAPGGVIAERATIESGPGLFAASVDRCRQAMHSSTWAVLHWLPDVSSTCAGAPSPALAVACATLNATGSASWTAAKRLVSVRRRIAISLMSAEKYQR
jgi:hypothetical protein